VTITQRFNVGTGIFGLHKSRRDGWTIVCPRSAPTKSSWLCSRKSYRLRRTVPLGL